MIKNNTLFSEASRLEEKGEAFAIAFVIYARGSVPRNSGRMIIRKDGSIMGSVGGGAMEAQVIQEASAALQIGESRTVRRRLTPQGDDAIGMECGGTLEVRIDVVATAPRLLLLGGGHVNLAVAAAAFPLGFAVEIIDTRIEFCNAHRFPMARKLWHDDDIVKAIDRANPDDNTWAVIATHNNDVQALTSLVERNCAYLGMLGSKRKVAIAIARLREKGTSEKLISQLRMPIGLDIGAETPQEIAVSIMAEILKVQSGRCGLPLQGMSKDLVVIRGGGDLASGTAWRLRRCGFKVLILETHRPTAIRRKVAFATALFDRTITIEGIQAQKAENTAEAFDILETGDIPVLADPDATSLKIFKPSIVVDAIMAKKNCGTYRSMAPTVIALGPGFTAGSDCHAVIETSRGHNLGRVIDNGAAAANTGIPGAITGKSTERVLRATEAGVFRSVVDLGDLVKKNQIVARIESNDKVYDISAPFAGKIRGLLVDKTEVDKSFKVGDIDPRGSDVDELCISDKARAIAGAVLEAIFRMRTEGQSR